MKFINNISSKLSSELHICVYACCYLILTFCNFCIFTYGTIALSVLSKIIVIWTLLIIIFAILAGKIKLRSWKFLLITLFVISYIVSAIAGRNYGGLFNAIKGVVWLAAQGFVLFCVSNSGLSDKYYNKFLTLFVCVATVFTVISIIMAIVGFSYIPPELGNNNFHSNGVIFGRLFGFYTDPTYGAIISFLSIIALFYMNYKRNIKTQKLKLALSAIIILLHLIYICLTGSRTVFVSALITIVICVFIISAKCIRKNTEENFSLLKWIKVLAITVISGCFLIACTIAIPLSYEKLETNIFPSIEGPITDSALLYPRQYSNEINDALKIAQITDEEIAKANTKVAVAPDSEHVGLSGRDTGNDVSNQRFDLWKDAISIWKYSPVFGVSQNNLLNFAKEELPQSTIAKTGVISSHNILFDVLASQGILGLATFIAIGIAYLISTIKTLRKQEKSNFIKQIILLSIVIFMVCSSMFYPELIYCHTVGGVVFWYTLGITQNENDKVLKG